MVQRWQVTRSWVIQNHGDAREQIGTRDLSEYRACGMLGAAGLGKTYELSYLADCDRQRGLDVRLERLAVLGQTPDGLEARLNALASTVTDRTVIYLDALDEVMVPVKTAGLILGRWIRDRLNTIRPPLRISCRSAVWPSGVQAAIREVYGKDESVFAWLQPMSSQDIRSAAAFHNVDADAFVQAIAAAQD